MIFRRKPTALPKPPDIKPCATLPAHLLANAKIVPDRIDILPHVPKGGTIVEIGVALGDFTEYLLRICEPAQFIAIDIFTLHQHEMVWDRPSRDVFAGRTHRQFYEQRFATEIARGRLHLIEGDSVASLATLADSSISVAYVDAEHSYASVSAELAALRPKLHGESWVLLNDYIMNDIGGGYAPYGVIQATHEFMLSDGWEMAFLALHPLMYCDVAIRRTTTT